MKPSCSFRIVSIAAFLAPLIAVSAPTYNWLGGGSGNWSDANNWENGHVPVSGDCASFEGAAYDQTINFDMHAQTGYWVVGEGDPLNVFDMVWNGAGSLTNSVTSTTELRSYRKLIVDGPDIWIKKAFAVQENAEFEMRSGHFHVQSGSTVKSNSIFRIIGGRVGSSMTVRTNAIVEVKGGILDVYGDFVVQTNAMVRLSGGVLSFAKAPSGLTADRWSFTGGTLRWANGTRITTDMFHFLPPKGAILEYSSSSDEALYVGAGGSVSFDGTVVATNRSTESSGVRIYKKDFTFSGKGAFIVDRLQMDGGNTATIELSALKLGKELASRGSDGAEYRFPKGIAFGAWGDWSNIRVDGGVPPAIHLAGDVSFDTLDCIDVATSRSIALTRCVDDGITSLSVMGGGVVDLSFSAGLDAIDRLYVGDGTMLVMTNTTTTISVRNLKMDAKAKIMLASGKGAIEVLNEPSLAEDAQIVFENSGDGLISGLYPLWSDGSGGAIPPQIVVNGLDEGSWSVRTSNGVCYLSDGREPELVDTEKCEWLGTNSSVWSDSSNWARGMILNGSAYGYFTGERNLFVTNDSPRTFRYPIFAENAGPYVISGEDVSVTYPESDSIKEGSNSLRHNSRFPVVFETPFHCKGRHGYFRILSDSYAALLGGGDCNGVIYVHGDLRLGGNWSATNLHLYGESSFERQSRLTIMPGGLLTLCDSDGTLVSPQNLQIEGILELSNTLVSVENAAWRGSGAIKTHNVRTESSSAAFELGDALTIYPQYDWLTVSADNPSAALTIAARETPTLGATKDWSYGPQIGVETMLTPYERALRISSGSTLTVDTENPDTGVGHAIAFVDPIVGEGSLVKAGSGDLVFATSLSRIDGTFRIEGGKVRLDAAYAAEVNDRWIAVMTAAAFEGLDDAMPSGWTYRIVPSGDGLLTCEFCKIRGLRVLFR